MVFSNENKILIKNLYQLSGYNAREFRTEFPDKEQTKSSTNRLVKKFRDTDTVDRRQGSGRPRSARTDENTDQVNDMVQSQDDQPGTHNTVCEISRGTGTSQVTCCPHHKTDLQMNCFKRRCVQKLTEANFATRMKRSKLLLI